MGSIRILLGANRVFDLVTTTLGAVAQPGTVLLTLVPHSEQLFIDVAINNEDPGFVRVGEPAQLKLAAPFQKYGMLTGKVIHVSGDASEQAKAHAASATSEAETAAFASNATYKARAQLDAQGW